MSQDVSLRDAEKKAVRMATNDGLWEILLGVTLLAFGVSAVLRDIWGVLLSYLPVVLVMAAGIPASRVAKKSLILPRIGQVEFSRKRRAKFKRVSFFLITLLVLTWILWLVPYLSGLIMGKPSTPYWFIDALFGLLIFIFFVFLFYALESPRMILYGLLFGLALPADVILQENFGITFPIFMFLTGTVMTAGGVITFVRFLKRYPMPEGDSSSQMVGDSDG
jgi:hypothetical protein